jgi:hypothetical protein
MKRSLGLLALSLVLSAIHPTQATTVIPPDFEKLVTDAEVIFQGEVTGVRSEWIGEGAQHRIVSFVTFKVEEALKGKPGATYSMRMLGGTVDGETLEVSDAPKFKVGDRDVLFMEHNGSQFIPLVGIQHGRFQLKRDSSGHESIVTGEGQPLATVDQLGHAEEQIAKNKTAMSLNDFKVAIHTRMSQAQNQAREQ